MIELTEKQVANANYNLSQAQVGSILKTLNGSKIRRSKFNVGKAIGGSIYLHKSYHKVLPSFPRYYYQEYSRLVPFEFNCVRLDTYTDKLAFIECADFNESREPRVGRICEFDDDGQIHISRSYQQIYHHKWTMVKNSYPGFDVGESWRWSAKWLSVLTRRADGSCLENWNNQLREFGLE